MGLPPLIWLAIGLVLLALEAVLPGMIVMWFGIGGILTALGVWTGILRGGAAQWLCFFLSSLVFILAWVFLLKKFVRKKDPTDVRDPSLLDLRGRVTRPVAPGTPGEVLLFQNFHGLKKWTAESSESLPEGTEIRVVESKGIRLVIQKSQGGAS
jgi:membrane protein implicated in regulation of membrane protease activity